MNWSSKPTRQKICTCTHCCGYNPKLIALDLRCRNLIINKWSITYGWVGPDSSYG